MKIIFLLILLIHGLIHLLGFLKAFQFAEISQLTQNISETSGLVWLTAIIIFLFASIQFIMKIEWWWLSAFLGILISQILIIIFWQDAKFGTIPNVIILLVAIIAFANWNFNRMTSHEISNLYSQNKNVEKSTITPKNLSILPIPVQKWLSKSGIVGKDKISFVRLKQKALMKMKPEQEDWAEATAEQYFTIENPAFIWKVKMKMKPFFNIVGRDLFINGKGRMTIKLLSLINVVDAAGEKIDTGTIQRFLGEMVWFPSAALSPYITWEPIDSLSARATTHYKGTVDSGIFYFNEQGDFIRYSAFRYMGNELNAERKKWTITANKVKEMNGIRIPVEMEATWELDSGDWNWLKLEISEIEYNIAQEYF